MHGSKPKYYHKYIGGNFRLDAMQAAGLLVKLPYLEQWSQARRRNADYYNGKFAGSSVQTPYIDGDCVSIYNQYCIRTARRDELAAQLEKNHIGCAIYYPVPLHLQECFKDLGYKQGDFPEAEKAVKEVIIINTKEIKHNHEQKILSLLEEFDIGLRAMPIAWKEIIPYVRIYLKYGILQIIHSVQCKCALFS